MLTLTQYQNQAVGFADIYWRGRIIDGTPDGNRIIGTEIISAVRAPMPDYTNGSFAWCGAFVAACYLRAGMHPQLVRMLASWYRAEALYGRYQDDPGVWDADYVVFPDGTRSHTWAWHVKCQSPRLCFRPQEQAIQPGDILIHRPGRGQNHGHVMLAVGAPETEDIYSRHPRIKVPTIEGNARGFHPDGKCQEGVGKRRHLLSYISRVVRPSLCDFDLTVKYEDA